MKMIFLLRTPLRPAQHENILEFFFYFEQDFFLDLGISTMETEKMENYSLKEEIPTT